MSLNTIDNILLENNLVTCPCCDIVMTYNNYLLHYNNNSEIEIYNPVNLYNSMIDRGFNNDIGFNNDKPVNDIGLGIENLSLYSTQITIKEDSYCVICMDTYYKGKSFYLMKCMHSFCDECSKRWFDFKSVCPLCKTNMKKI